MLILFATMANAQFRGSENSDTSNSKQTIIDIVHKVISDSVTVKALENSFTALKEAILSNLLANLIWFGLGIIITLIFHCIRTVLPTRRMWGLAKPEEAIICVSTSSVDDGGYKMYATGSGQLKAITHIVTSLNKAYKEFDYKNILFSREPMGDEIENDIILLGGPKNNQITKLFFEKLNLKEIVSQEADSTIWWKGESYKGKIENGKVKNDYGIIIKMSNPFSKGKNTKILLFSGSRTFGTIAAATYFCEYEYLRKELKCKKKKNFILFISCDVNDDYPVTIKLIDKEFI